MKSGKPGISSYDMFATGHAIRQELAAIGGNIFGLNTTLMKLSDGDDNGRASLDYTIGSREVRRRPQRQIGHTVSSVSGGLGPTSTPARTANLLGNPTIRRYESNRGGPYRFDLKGSPAIGEYYDIYESEGNRLRFMDDTVGRDLFGYTHLENAATERSGDAEDDKLYMRSTYSVFGDLRHPFDEQDIDVFKFGPRRYSPSEPYALKPLENNLVRRALNGSVQGFMEKFEAMTPDREQYKGSLLNLWDFMGSHYYLNLLNGVAEHGLYVENYENERRNRVSVYDRNNIPQSDYAYFLDVDTISYDKDIKGLINKTNRLFHDGKIKSLVNRFATLNGNNEGRPGFLNTATDHIYGLSRGRNLRKLDLTNENGYPNPYCRVWTTHYQYAKYKNLIRGKWVDDSKNSSTDHYTLHKEDQLMRPNKGYERLRNMTSLDPENGRPIFTPYYVNDRSEMEKDSVKRCMFSIENLAWKDIIPNSTLIRKGIEMSETRNETVKSGDGSITENKTITSISGVAKGFGMTLTKDQIGPNGGRIMWFPPYNLKFTEQAHADWNQNDFIGRGEKIYSYVNSERTGTLSFTILVDHPSIINEWARGGKMGKTANKTSPLSKDEMILRYFAGCDALEFNPRGEYDVPYTITKTESTKITMSENIEKVEVDTSKNVPDSPVQDEVPNEEPTITFYSVFYFPNNYAGEDFNNGTKPGGAVAAMKEFLERGDRSNGSIGYELGNGENISGMTYNGTYYYRGKDKNGTYREWYYPVDTRVNNEVLVNNQRYKDIHDFGLNANGGIYGSFLESVPSEDEIVEVLNTGNSGLTDSERLKYAKNLVRESEIDNKYFVPAWNFYKNLSEIITVFDSATKNSYRYNIDIQGFASKHGYTESNRILAENRASTIRGWIESLGKFRFGEGGNATISSNGNGELEETATSTESDFKPKAARAAVVKIEFIPNGDKTVITEAQEFSESPHYENRTVTSITEDRSVSVVEDFDTSAANDYENETYDNEYTYFKQINENDDMVKRYISDKVDYFDPAFHSITPEGFNARLTFLHQCLRQGPTISASDLGMGSRYGAGNLSFGRAPFCILRIGDFFNTKICIDSINIEYDAKGGVQWDLNPEGIGLQPMIANVNVNFKFLGGSDISGPISRLQNAVSFNYYANTSVYDRRSDYRDTFIGKDDDTAMTWAPLTKQGNTGANVIEHRKFRTKPTDNK